MHLRGIEPAALLQELTLLADEHCYWSSKERKPNSPLAACKVHE